MQISIDTAIHSPRQIRAAIKVLQALVTFVESEAPNIDLPPIVVDAAPAGTRYDERGLLRPDLPAPSNVVPFVNPAVSSVATAPLPVIPTATAIPATMPRSPNDVFGVAATAPTAQRVYPPPFTSTYPPIPGEATSVVNPPSVAIPPPPIPDPNAAFALPAAVSAAAVPAGTDSVSAAVNGGVDKTGLPWDARIHSAGQNRLNDDGTWRKRRGVSDQMVATVEAELRARSGAVPTAPAAAPVPLPPISPVPMPPGATAMPVGSPVATPSVPPAPIATDGAVPAPQAAVSVPAAPPASTGPTFMQLMTQANRYCAEQRYSMQQLTADCAKAGVTLNDLPTNAIATAMVWNNMENSVGPPRAQ